MSLRMPSLKTLALVVAGLVAAWLLFAWLALPRLLKYEAEKFVAEKTGHQLTLDLPEFNPFQLRLVVPNLRLAEPDGKLLFAFRSLLVDLSSKSILRGAFVFDTIRLDAPRATLVMHRDGSLNWTALLDAFKDKEEKPAAPLPRLTIGSFAIAGGALDFSDESIGFSTHATPLDLELSDLSTLPDNTGHYRISARTGVGARVLWQGDATLNPPAASGSVSIDDLDLARLAPYFSHALPVAQPAGTAALSVAYHAAYANGRLDLTLDRMIAKLADLRLALAGKDGAPSPAIAVDTIKAGNGRFDLAAHSFTLDALTVGGAQLTLPRPGAAAVTMRLGALAIDKIHADLAAHTLAVDAVALRDGRVQAVRDSHGRIDLAEALAAVRMPAAAEAKSAPPPEAAPWRVTLGKLEAIGFAAAFRDEAVAPAAELALDDIGLSVEGISNDLAKPLPLHASFKARTGGSFAADGQVVPATPSAELRFKLADLALKPAQPYLASVARLTLGDGQLSVDGAASYDAHGAAFKGGFALRRLRLTEKDTNNVVLALKSLDSRDVQAAPASLRIGTMTLDGLDTRLIINKDKSTNLTRILAGQPAAAPARDGAAKGTAGQEGAAKPATQQAAAGGNAAHAEAAASRAPAKDAPGFVASIGRLRVTNGAMDFADHSLALPFGTRINKLHGTLSKLSSRPGAPGQVELEGQVDDYGLARAVGQIDLFDPTAFTDMKVVFRNVEMTRLTPYAATFAGRRINSGKLSLDLEYKIDKRQLAGDNKIVMDQLTLGERVESPQAKNLPLDLAIALLQDSDGRIDLGLPVSGSLDDPQFSLGGIVWKAIVNVLTKIVTAPFRALFGGGGEKLENVAFEVGNAQLTPPEQEKLVRLAGMLAKRPRLALTVHGVYADTDRVALQDRQLRSALAAKVGGKADKRISAKAAEKAQADGDVDTDPGAISTADPKVQAALEALFSERFGAAELAALKDGFRKANPGQMKQSVTGKMMSRLSGLFREKKTLGAADVAQLKGADFYAVLYERLRDKEQVGDARLTALAKVRGDNVAAALRAAGTPAGRIAVAAPEKVDGKDQEVPVKLSLGAAAQTAAAPAAEPPAAPVPASPR